MEQRQRGVPDIVLKEISTTRVIDVRHSPTLCIYIYIYICTSIYTVHDYHSIVVYDQLYFAHAVQWYSDRPDNMLLS